MPNNAMRVTLVGASIVRESELPGFESLTDFASENFNLAIASLKASVLQDAELSGRVRVELLDFGMGWDRKSLGERELHAVLDTRPDVVGLSCYCWSIDTLLELAGALGDRENRPFLLLGGPSAGPIASELLADHPFIDAVAVGEGESTFTALLRALDRHEDLSVVPGLVYRGADGAPVASATPDCAVALDRLPSPYRTGVIGPSRSMLLETSRGCRFRCKFCSWMGGGGRLRYVPIDSIEADLRWAVAHDIHAIKFADTAINFHTDRVRDLTDAIRRADPCRSLRFTYFLKPELLTDEQAACLQGIRADEIIIGVESLTDAARRAVGKPRFDAAEFERVVGLMQSIGPVTASFILGLPGDSEQGLRHTLDWISAFDRAHPGAFHEICLFWLALLPGANLHANRAADGFRVAPRETPYVLESRHADADTLLAMARSSIEAHYRHPNLRVEYFHKEYLTQDAPAADRHVHIERRLNDARPCVLLVGLVDPDTQRLDGLRPYSLEIAWMKSYAEAQPAIRRSTRIELVHVDVRPAATPAEIAAEVDRLRPYAPGAVVVCHRAGSPAFADALVERLASALPQASVLACNGADIDAARAWMERVPSLAGVFPGEPEIAFRDWLAAGMAHCAIAGMAVRIDGEVRAGAPATFVEALDEIPSPLQWGFVQRTGAAIAMRWSRPPTPSRPGVPRVFGPERVFGDMRWAIEQRHEHVIWIDDELPAAPALVREFVAAIRRADPEGRVLHTFAISPQTLTEELVELLAQIPVREIRVRTSPPSGPLRKWLDSLCARTGARLVETAAPPTGTGPDLETLLHPWRIGAVVERWRLDRIDAVAAQAGAARLRFTWEDGAVVLIELQPSVGPLPGAPPSWRARVELPEGQGRAPERAVRRLTEMITRILDAGRRRSASARRT